MPPYALPYASGQLYDRGPSRTIGELLRAQSEAQAAAVAQQGAMAAQRWGQLGHTISGTIGDIVQARQDAPIRAAQAAEQRMRIENARMQMAEHQAQVVAQQQAGAQQRALQEYFGSLGEGEDPDPRKVVSIVGPQAGAKLLSEWSAFKPKPPAPLGTHVVGDALVDDTGKALYTAPPKPVEAKPETRSLDVQAADALARGDTEAYNRFLRVKKEMGLADNRPPSTPQGTPFWVVRNGQPVRITEAQYRPGDLPANTREQGRPVTAGDAEDLSGVDEALKLAGGLNFKPGDTGVLPSIGGALPDFVTSTTGIGVEAKKRQGTINLVKQIIGKGLEGGVLRKEDEEKYKKMLPTLSDAPDVVTSKVETLIQTLKQKKDTRLNSLEDANYDVSKFRARDAKPNGPITVGGFTVTVEP